MRLDEGKIMNPNEASPPVEGIVFRPSLTSTNKLNVSFNICHRRPPCNLEIIEEKKSNVYGLGMDDDRVWFW
jgi:hypothetical protein